MVIHDRASRHVSKIVMLLADFRRRMLQNSGDQANFLWRVHRQKCRGGSEPNGPRGLLVLHIPAQDTKSKKQDITAELPDEVR